MRPQKAVVKETIRIAIGTTLLTAITIVVMSIINGSVLPSLFGGLIGALLAIGNFFLLGITVQKSVTAIQEGDEAAKKLAKNKMNASYSTRMLGVFLLEVFAIAVLKLDAISCMLPLLFPRITIFFIGIFDSVKKSRKE